MNPEISRIAATIFASLLVNRPSLSPDAMAAQRALAIGQALALEDEMVEALRRRAEARAPGRSNQQ